MNRWGCIQSPYPLQPELLGGLDARTMLDYVRGHWSLENRLHWSLDVSFREDTLRNRAGHSVENF